MSQLTANAIPIYEDLALAALPVKASTEIFRGSAVGLTAGYARQLVAADLFGGIADQHINNTGADGALYIPVILRGNMQVAIAGAVVTDINKAVYMSDGNTFTYTSAGNTLVGRVVRFVSAGVVTIRFDSTTQAAS